MTKAAGLLLWASFQVHAAELPNHLSREERQAGFRLLFDGKTLSGWEGDPQAWRVEDGAIVGSSDHYRLAQNTFLIHRELVRDFILRLQVKLRNGNSGIQFRSIALPGWVVSGYQADLSDAGERSAWGNFYEERGRSRSLMKTPDEGWQRARSVVRMGDWNDYEILAHGNRFRLTLNGVVTIDQTDDKSARGVVALQLHSGEPMRVDYRSIRIRGLE